LRAGSRHTGLCITICRALQLPIDKWHELIGDPTYADAILDRLVHNAHRIELTGDSLRKRRKAEPAAASVAAVPRARS